jgi:nicotinate phosphoribosyltransferase
LSLNVQSNRRPVVLVLFDSMNITRDLYRHSLNLLTDLYQVTMAYGYWKTGKAETESVFNLFFRENPFGGGYAVNCGLSHVIDFLDSFHFDEEDLRYLASLKGANQEILFEPDFLSYLSSLKFSCSVDAIPEGRIVFPHEPVIKVSGPVLQCQLIETPLLNLVNFQTLVATKSSRVNYAAKGDSVMEFGLRRAQGIDGALAASRAAYIGGCSSTSNVLAGKMFGIPVAGTHAHSWVLTFDNESEAFKAYAEALPNNCILLVDTYNTVTGIRNAIEVGKMMKQKHQELLGIRIDSGDLAYFSKVARKMLDEAGLTEVKIVASNDLDEKLIQSLKNQGAKISVWGIGTRLVTAYDQPALGAVYKMSSIKNSSGKWEDRIKLSEQALKVNHPGNQQVRRFYDHDQMTADMIFDLDTGCEETTIIIDPADLTHRKKLDIEKMEWEDLLKPVFASGERIYQSPSLTEIKITLAKDFGRLDESIKRFEYPHNYPVGLEKSLFDRKMELILQLRNLTNGETN